jgi:hypothetical protein
MVSESMSDPLIRLPTTSGKFVRGRRCASMWFPSPPPAQLFQTLAQLRDRRTIASRRSRALPGSISSAVSSSDNTSPI